MRERGLKARGSVNQGGLHDEVGAVIHCQRDMNLFGLLVVVSRKPVTI